MFVPRLNGHDYARISEVLICSVCGLAVARRWWQSEVALLEGRIFFSRAWYLWLLAIWLLALTSVTHATVTSRALQEMIHVLGLLAVAAAVASANWIDIQRYWQVTVLATLFYSVITLLVLIVGILSGFAVNVENSGIGYGNIRFFNHVQTVALPLVATTIHQASLSRIWLTAAWIALITGFTLLWLSGGRGTFVGIAVATLLLPLCMRRLTWRCARPLILSAIIGYFVYLLLFVQLPSAIGIDSGTGLLQRATDPSTARVYLWGLAITYIQESPLLGIGPMHFAHRPNLKGAHPHNVFLQIAAEWGLPILLLLLMGTAAALRRVINSIRETLEPNDKCVGGTLFIACIALLIDGLVSGNFVMPVSQVWIAVCLGITAHWVRCGTPVDIKMPPVITVGLAHRLGAVLLGSMMILQTVLLLGDVIFLDELLKRSRELSVSSRLRPRFWIDGWF